VAEEESGVPMEAIKSREKTKGGEPECGLSEERARSAMEIFWTRGATCIQERKFAFATVLKLKIPAFQVCENSPKHPFGAKKLYYSQE
jgi:hypothetical protein